LLPNQIGLRIEKVETNATELQIIVKTASPSVPCPVCGQMSSKEQSRYQRTLTDLNWANYSVKLTLQLRRFFCPNSNCKRQIFCERLTGLAEAYARSTTRLSEHFQKIALALGGRPAERLLGKQGIRVSRTTLLQKLFTLPLPLHLTSKVLGVDDFALRKGTKYGTLLVDLETRKPIEVLPDRTADTLAKWLTAHPGVEIVSRDRSSSYSEAVQRVNPKIVQVADRFHLLKNLSRNLLTYFQRKQIWQQSFARSREDETKLKEVRAVQSPEPGKTSGKPKKLTKAELKQQHTYEQRLARYNAVVELHRQGKSQRAIAKELGIDFVTVNRYLKAGTAEIIKIKPQRLRPSKLDPYKSYLRQRWIENQPTIPQLYAEVIAKGYTGSIGPVRAFLAPLRPYKHWGSGRGGRQKLSAKELPANVYRYKISSSEAAWLLLKKLTKKEKNL
jgi:transposase